MNTANSNAADTNVVKRITANLDAVIEGLLQVKKAIEAAGFEEASSGYRQMKDVLVQQRLWGLTHPSADLERHWRLVEKTALEARQPLAEFCTILDQLARAAAIAAPPALNNPDPDCHRTLSSGKVDHPSQSKTNQ